MATSNSKQTKVLLATFITFFLLLLNKVNSADQLSFRFDKFVPNPKDLLFQGDASVSSTGVLQVTKVENGKPKPYSVGRARYIAPLHLWDSTTGKVASFYSSFTFVVKAPDASKTSDGLAFFLAPIDSQIPSGRISRYIGLFNNPNYDSSNQIVAVEFDTYFGKDYDPWDPNFRHIGIDVNSINSTKTVKWDWRNGEVATVEVIYEAHLKKLTVHLFYDSPLTDMVRLEASVDLKAILPEWVRVGFCAATGASGALETHDVLSWVFNSAAGSSSFSAMENNMHSAGYTA